jgi:hypothetical protein
MLHPYIRAHDQDRLTHSSSPRSRGMWAYLIAPMPPDEVPRRLSKKFVRVIVRSQVPTEIGS